MDSQARNHVRIESRWTMARKSAASLAPCRALCAARPRSSCPAPFRRHRSAPPWLGVSAVRQLECHREPKPDSQPITPKWRWPRGAPDGDCTRRQLGEAAQVSMPFGDRPLIAGRAGDQVFQRCHVDRSRPSRCHHAADRYPPMGGKIPRGHRPRRGITVRRRQPRCSPQHHHQRRHQPPLMRPFSAAFGHHWPW